MSGYLGSIAIRVATAADLDAAMKELFAVDGPALHCVEQVAELL